MMRFILILIVAFSCNFAAVATANEWSYSINNEPDVTPLQPGLLLNAPDLTNEDNTEHFNFQASSDAENYTAGISARLGSFIFGFEAIQNGDVGGLSGAHLGPNNGSNLTGSSDVVTDNTYRMLFGVALQKNTVLYGFSGMTDRNARHSMSYYDEEHISVDREYLKSIVDECGRQTTVSYVETVSADITSTANSSQYFQNLGLMLGAGFEQSLFGGTLRFEYAMTQFNPATLQLAIQQFSTDESVAASGTKLKNVSWDSVLQHDLRLRWIAQF